MAKLAKNDLCQKDSNSDGFKLFFMAVTFVLSTPTIALADRWFLFWASLVLGVRRKPLEAGQADSVYTKIYFRRFPPFISL